MIKLHNSIDQAIKYFVKDTYFPFIVAEEVDGPTFLDEDGNEHKQTRRFLTFRDLSSYVDNIEHYNHCHELVIPQSRNNDMVKMLARVAFDFDIPNHVRVPESFASSMERVITEVFENEYTGVDVRRLQFVWLMCDNPKKTSMHLIVKGAVFTEWEKQLKILYEQILIAMKRSDRFMWVDPSLLIDRQLARNRASLRMPLNSKLGGNPLRFRDADRFAFSDGLVCLYGAEDKKSEQRIHPEQLKGGDIYPTIRSSRPGDYSMCEEDITVMVEDAYELFHKYNDPSRSFSLGPVIGRWITLVRTRSSRCIIGGKRHDSDHAYLLVTPKKEVYFFCRRQCECNGKRGKMLTPKCKPGMKLSLS